MFFPDFKILYVFHYLRYVYFQVDVCFVFIEEIYQRSGESFLCVMFFFFNIHMVFLFWGVVLKKADIFWRG